MLGGFPLGCRNGKVTGKTDVSEDIRDRFKPFKSKQHSCSSYIRRGQMLEVRLKNENEN